MAQTGYRSRLRARAATRKNIYTARDLFQGFSVMSAGAYLLASALGGAIFLRWNLNYFAFATIGDGIQLGVLLLLFWLLAIASLSAGVIVGQKYAHNGTFRFFNGTFALLGQLSVIFVLERNNTILVLLYTAVMLPLATASVVVSLPYAIKLSKLGHISQRSLFIGFSSFFALFSIVLGIAGIGQHGMAANRYVKINGAAARVYWVGERAIVYRLPGQTEFEVMLNPENVRLVYGRRRAAKKARPLFTVFGHRL